MIDVEKLIQEEWNTAETPWDDEEEETEKGEDGEDYPWKDTGTTFDVRHDVVLTVWTVHFDRIRVIWRCSRRYISRIVLRYECGSILLNVF